MTATLNRGSIMLMRLLAMLALLHPLHARSQEVSAQAFVTAIEVPVRVRDAAGNVPDHLGPEDFVLFEDGTPRPVIAVERIRSRSGPRGGEWQVVLWFDLTMTSSYTIRSAAEVLRKHAAMLTDLGVVELIVHDGQEARRTRVGGAEELSAALLDVARRSPRDEIGSLRRRYLQEAGEGGRSEDSPYGRMLIRAALREEQSHQRRFERELLRSAAVEQRKLPRLLILVTDGFDRDPREFYTEDLPASSPLHAEIRPFNTTPLEQELAAHGWMTIAVTGGVGAFFPSAADAPGSTLEAMTQRTRSPGFLLMHPADVLTAITDATAGEFVSDARRLPEVVDRLEDGFVLTYQVDRPADDSAHRIEVSSPRGLLVRAPGWTRSASSRVLTDLKLRRILSAGRGEEGLLRVDEIRFTAERAEGGARRGNLSAAVDFRRAVELRPTSKRPVRVSVAIASDGDVFISHQVIEFQPDGDARLRFDAPLIAPESSFAAALVFEDLLTGETGSGFLPLGD